MNKSLPALASKTEELLSLYNEQDSLTAGCLVDLEQLTAQLTKITSKVSILTKAQKKQKSALEVHARRLASLNQENEILLEQLLSTQEELEKQTSKNGEGNSELGAFKRSLQRVLNIHPNYWCYDTLTVKPDNLAGTIEWYFTDTIVADRHYPDLKFRTILNDGIAGIIIQSPHAIDSLNPLLRWPSADKETDEIHFAPVKAPFNSSTNANLNSLGPTDWKFLKSLVRQLSSFIENPAHTELDGINTSSLQNGLILLDNTLQKWPEVFRYDQIYLRETLIRDDYYALEIELINPQLGKYTWPDFTYRIATVREPGCSFHKNPRLQFSSDSNVLQNWYAESEDSNGARLELRFSMPNLMDTTVWGKLAGADQILIAALLGSASTQLSMLRHELEINHQPLDEWLAVCETMRSIFSNIASEAS